MADYTVRPARTTDLDRLLAFNLAMAQETEGRALDEATVRRGVLALLEDGAKGRYFVAESGARIAGQIMLTREWSDWRNGEFWWIQSVYVAPGHRRRGVFRRLFEFVRARAVARDNVCGLRLYVEHNNEVAQQTYRALGGTHCDYRMMEWAFTQQSP